MNPRYRRPYVLPHAKAAAVLSDALDAAFAVHADQLDCRVSMTRQDTTKTSQEVLAIALADPRTLWNFILREKVGDSAAYADVGCCTRDPDDIDINYFLWVAVKTEDAERIAAKHGLEPWV